jgi:hypothetical protein
MTAGREFISDAPNKTGENDKIRRTALQQFRFRENCRGVREGLTRSRGEKKLINQ